MSRTVRLLNLQMSTYDLILLYQCRGLVILFADIYAQKTIVNQGTFPSIL